MPAGQSFERTASIGTGLTQFSNAAVSGNGAHANSPQHSFGPLGYRDRAGPSLYFVGQVNPLSGE
jgi:hypothetical protein